MACICACSNSLGRGRLDARRHAAGAAGMRIIDERSKVRGIADRWKATYIDRLGNGWTFADGRKAADIYRDLVALDDETATAKDVAEIIGNNAWAGPAYCHECGMPADRTVEIGQPPDHESHTAEVCEGCLRKALTLLATQP